MKLSLSNFWDWVVTKEGHKSFIWAEELVWEAFIIDLEPLLVMCDVVVVDRVK